MNDILERQKSTLYPLADILGMRLGLVTPKNKAPYITSLKGGCRKPYPLSNLISLNPQMDIKASCVTSISSWVLVRVMGDMYLFVCYDNQKGIYTILVLDAEKMAITPAVINSVNGLLDHSAKNILKHAVTTKYTKLLNAPTWVKEDEAHANFMDK